MRLASEALEPDQQIPLQYTKEDRDVSPPVGWFELHEGTRELALIFERPRPGWGPTGSRSDPTAGGRDAA